MHAYATTPDAPVLGACTQSTLHDCDPALGERHTTYTAPVLGACTQSTLHACGPALGEPHTTPTAPVPGACTQRTPRHKELAPGRSNTTQHPPALDGIGKEEAKGYTAFVARAMAQPCPLGLKLDSVPGEQAEALRWTAERTSQQVQEAREQVVRDVERLDLELRTNGAAASWLTDADDETKAISRGVNGPLGELLARATGFTDLKVMEVFRTGGPIAGTLAQPVGTEPKDFPAPTSPEALADGCEQRNQKLLDSLTDDPHSDFLLQQTLDDVAAGRMTAPTAQHETGLKGRVVSRRFSREQGTRKDGTLKLRAIDDETACGTNATTQPTARLCCDGADVLATLALLFAQLTGEAPGFWKADVDKAYRRIPVAPSHRWLLWVCFSHKGQRWLARHNAMPFGSVASVHAWDRVGAFLRHLGRTMLKLLLGRYVDDFFAVDRRGDTEHALWCFGRLVRAVLGADSLAANKMEFGHPLQVLGLHFEADKDGVSVRVTDEKAQKWLHDVENALKTKQLGSGQAAKLAGRLSFAAQHTFRKLGRAMLRPLFQQEHAPLKGGRLGSSLRLALSWWKQVLALKLTQRRLVRQPTEVVELFCDARGTPPRLSAVLFADGVVEYTDLATPQQLLDLFGQRDDAQIMGQELLAIALGLCTFLKKLRGRCVRVWTDNKGGECCLRSGAARAGDHNLLVHALWLLAAKENFGLWVERVRESVKIKNEAGTRSNTCVQ